MTVGILFDRLRWEEKELAQELSSLGAKVEMIDAKNLVLDLEESIPLPSLILERCVSYQRGANVASVLEESLGVIVLNQSSILDLCGNKLRTSEILARRGISTPRTIVAFSAASALEAFEKIGYPCVMKPIVGSWGRQVVPVRDREIAEALIEMRELQQSGDSNSSIFYVQEMVKRPPRDIRCITCGEEIVTCVYRYAAPSSWKTNVALGGHTEICPLTPDLEDIVSRTVRAIGKTSILGIDLMEDPVRGYVVHEVNGTVEFRGAQQVTEKSIARSMAEYALQVTRTENPKHGMTPLVFGDSVSE